MHILVSSQYNATKQMPASTDSKNQLKLRTISRMNTLRIETGTKNPHQFSLWLQERASSFSWPDLVDSNRLYKYFKGQVSRHPSQIINMLGQVFSNVEKKYWEGPEGLWISLWGSHLELSTSIKKTCNSSERDSIDNAIKNFFMRILVHGESNLPASVSIYRYLSITDPYSRLSDGNGFSMAYSAYQQALKNLDTAEVQSTLTELGVYEGVRREIIEIERTRIASKPTWVTPLECERF